MDKLNIIYDNYKESNVLVQNFIIARNKYFKNLILIIFANLLFLLYPNDFIVSIKQLLNNQYNINFANIYIIIQATLWFSTTIFIIQYIHKNIYIERQYIYLNNVEKELCKLTNSDIFNREGDNYLKDYPMVLNILDFFYKWLVPTFIILILGLKLYFEFKVNVCLFLKIFDSACFIYIFLVIVFYLVFLHYKKRKNRKNLKIKIIIAKNTKN